MVRPRRSDHIRSVLNRIYAAQECDATDDAIKNFSWVHKKNSRYKKSNGMQFRLLKIIYTTTRNTHAPYGYCQIENVHHACRS